MSSQDAGSTFHNPSGSGFAVTQWSMVIEAGHGSGEALSDLCNRYWYPLYAFLRHRGYSSHDAKDLTQGFFALFIDKQYFATADPKRGRFRTFLLAALQNFVGSQRAHQNAKKRGGTAAVVALDASEAELQYEKELCEHLTPETLFERKWALTVIDQALKELRGEYERAKRVREFEALRPYLTGEKKPHGYTDEVELLEMSEGAMRVAVHRIRKSYGRKIREVVASTVAQPEQVTEELQHLLSVLGE